MIDDTTRESARPWHDPARLIVMFAAGFLATLVFHQGVFAILHGVGVISVPPYRADPTWPLGVPQVISIAFWVASGASYSRGPKRGSPAVPIEGTQTLLRH